LRPGKWRTSGHSWPAGEGRHEPIEDGGVRADHYPSESREKHQEGDCTIHVYVKEDGTVSDLRVTKSTGFAALPDFPAALD
jgi:outer membrane biosynthesis protein TonB